MERRESGCGIGERSEALLLEDGLVHVPLETLWIESMQTKQIKKNLIDL